MYNYVLHMLRHWVPPCLEGKTLLDRVAFHPNSSFYGTFVFYNEHIIPQIWNIFTPKQVVLKVKQDSSSAKGLWVGINGLRTPAHLPNPLSSLTIVGLITQNMYAALQFPAEATLSLVSNIKWSLRSWTKLMLHQKRLPIYHIHDLKRAQH